MQKQEWQHGCVQKNIYQNLNYSMLDTKRKRTMSEKSESKRIGAKQHKNSGRNTKKGDATWENFTVDFKENSKSFTLNQDVWAKATTDAIRNGNDPAIVVVLGEGNKKIRLAIIELELLEQMVNNGTE
jgi:outer membrane phospholipase A